jgi:hypothetical protein
MRLREAIPIPWGGFYSFPAQRVHAWFDDLTIMAEQFPALSLSSQEIRL